MVGWIFLKEYRTARRDWNTLLLLISCWSNKRSNCWRHSLVSKRTINLPSKMLWDRRWVSDESVLAELSLIRVAFQVYWAIEDNDCCTRNCCGPSRPFDMKIMDIYKNEVIHMNRPLACSSCWFPCCLQSMTVSAPPGNVIGTVEQEWSICFPSFAIKNDVGETVLRIEGPLCTFSLCGDVEFKVISGGFTWRRILWLTFSFSL